jgi:cephalosporin hydroxylase
MGDMTMELWDQEMRIKYYEYIHNPPQGVYKNYPRWRDGALVVKFPQDMILYAQVIFNNKPDFIIETGTWFGGSACFFADMLLLNGGKGVITIDVKSEHQPPHPMVEYITSSSTDLPMFRRLRSRLKGKGSVMVVLDSNHATKHVAKELELYRQLVTAGQYMVVEDCWTRHEVPYPPHAAVQGFIKDNDEFELKHPEDQFVYAVTRDGWLLKK